MLPEVEAEDIEAENQDKQDMCVKLLHTEERLEEQDPGELLVEEDLIKPQLLFRVATVQQQ